MLRCAVLRCSVSQVIVKREMLPQLRAEVSRHHGGMHFDAVFELLTPVKTFSQFNISTHARFLTVYAVLG